MSQHAAKLATNRYSTHESQDEFSVRENQDVTASTPKLTAIPLTMGERRFLATRTLFTFWEEWVGWFTTQFEQFLTRLANAKYSTRFENWRFR